MRFFVIKIEEEKRMRNVWNFSAGPAQLPLEVLKKAQEELVSYKDTGMSVMEMSHRSKDYQEIMEDTEDRLRRVMNVSEDYAVLFLQGGASGQFLMAPMNLNKNGKTAFIHTGNWSKKAIEAAEEIGVEIDIIATSEDKNFTYIPEWTNDFQAYDYVHITTNNTIEGTVFTDFPDTENIPLVADMSSNILSEPIDVNKFGLIYAGAQKNLGIAGLTIVIIRKDLLNLNPSLPAYLNYNTHAKKESAYNTPATYAIYMSNLVLEWVENLGGLEAVYQLNKEKADLFYDYLDHSKLFKATVFGRDRSLMNIPFITGDESLDKKFITYANKHQIKNIKGHRSIGGMRASIYNSMPIQGVEALIQVMNDFEKIVKGREKV